MFYLLIIRLSVIKLLYKLSFISLHIKFLFLIIDYDFLLMINCLLQFIRYYYIFH